jgi:hypothetical protein
MSSSFSAATAMASQIVAQLSAELMKTPSGKLTVA